MALQHPLKYPIAGLSWGPTAKTAEPPGYGQLGRFWYSRYDSFRFYYHFHPARDYGSPEGAPIYASETGIVSAVGYNPLSSASGIRYNVRIRPGTIYGGGHCSAIAKNPRTGKTWAVGDKIRRGEVIALVGHTGTASGNHVHFFLQSRVPGTTQSMLYDPALFLPGGANANDPRILPYY